MTPREFKLEAACDPTIWENIEDARQDIRRYEKKLAESGNSEERTAMLRDRLNTAEVSLARLNARAKRGDLH